MLARSALSFTKGASGEIGIHLVVLITVLVPVLVLLFPAALLLVAASMLTNHLPANIFSMWINDSPSAALVCTFLVAFTIAAVAVFVSRSRQPMRGTRLRDLVGSDGDRLMEIVTTIWRQLGGGTVVPSVRWFPAIDVAAYAESRYGSHELQISTGLWRLAVSGEAVARGIIAHEIGHLIYRDSWTLEILKAGITGARAVMVVTGALTGMTLCVVLANEAIHLIERDAPVFAIAAEGMRILAAASFILVILPLGWIALRRQVAYITSLIEIRADVVAALWTDGLHRFTQVFASSENVVRTTDRDLIASLLSPSFSHIPERERLLILGTPALLVTPKVRFFTLSLLLVFLLPINFGTSYLFGGSANHLAMQSLVAALNVAIVILPILGIEADSIAVPKRRLVAIAIVSCLVTALPRINLEPLSYLSFSWLMGFGGTPTDWAVLSAELLETASDLGHKIQEALLNVGTPASIVVAYVGLITLTKPVGGGLPAHVKIRSIMAGAGAVAASFIAGYDPFRSLSIPGTEWVGSVIAPFECGHGLLLSLPIASASIIDASMRFARSFRVGQT